MDPLLFLQSPLRWLRQATAERATITSAPNFAYELCVKEAGRSGIEGIDLSSLTAAVCGGEPVWPETVERFCETFAPAGFDRSVFAPSYGLAEATLLVSSSRRTGGPRVFSGAVRQADGGEATEVRTVNLGRTVRSVAVRVVDAAGAECAEGTVGEIEISGASVGRPAGDPGDGAASGRVLTGDLGFVVDGELHISGRRKELIILRGQNVYPADIENAAVRADPAIRAGALAAVAVREQGTESMLLAFEVERGTRIEEAFPAICARLNQGIARATGHMPAKIIAVPLGALPRTTSGKIKRNQVIGLYREGRLPVLAATGMERAATEASLP